MKVATIRELLSLSEWEFKNRASDIIHAEERKKEAAKKSSKRFWFWVLFEGGSILPYLLLSKFGAIDKPSIGAFIVSTIVILIISSVLTMDSLPGISTPYGGKPIDTPCPVWLTGDHPLVSTIFCFAIPIAYIILARTL